MVYYKDLSTVTEKGILERASKDAEHFSEEERKSLANICKALSKWEMLNKKENEILVESDLSEPKTKAKIAIIKEEKERLNGWVSWWKLQGNQGMAFRENRKPFAFKIVGYIGHEGCFTPGIGVFEC